LLAAALKASLLVILALVGLLVWRWHRRRSKP
jgi:hypothetical protein